MLNTKILAKLLAVSSIIVVATSVTLLLRVVLFFLNKNNFVALNTRVIIHPTSKILIYILGIKIKIIGEILQKNALIVANHWGYLDSLCILATSPSIILSISNVGNVTVVGRILNIAGFPFIDRNNNKTIPPIIKYASDLLNTKRLNVCFFPEGEASDYRNIYPFNSSFFQIALNASCDVQPLTIQLTSINGEKTDGSNLDYFVFHNFNGNLLQHFIYFLSANKILITVHTGRIITKSEIENAHLTRKEICNKTEDEIRKQFSKSNPLSS